MSDEQLRDLERSWKESGGPQAEAALLQERVRTGGLEQDKLRLAAQLGHEAALLACEEPPLVPAELARRVGSDPQLRARAVLAVASCMIATGKAEVAREAEEEPLPHQRPFDPGNPERGVAALEAWVLSPDDEHASDLVEAIGHCDTNWCLLALAVDAASERDRQRSVESMVSFAASSGVSDHELRAALREDLAAWVLGYLDPVRKRVEARQGPDPSGPKTSA